MYSAEISRRCPGYFIFLIDQSGSMKEDQAGLRGASKAQGVADAVNRIIQNLIIQCSKKEGVVDYFFCSVIGYGAVVKSGLPDMIARPFASMSELDNNPKRIDSRMQRLPDGVGGIIDVPVNKPVWFEPVSSGRTPMCEALGVAYRLVESWLSQYPAGYPPIVMNLTDGQATDGEPLIAANRLRTLSTSDGPTLLFNIHLASGRNHPALFPSDPSRLVSNEARLLFEMSSILPDAMIRQANAMEMAVSPDARGFIYNADAVSVVQFLEIGTKPANLALR